MIDRSTMRHNIVSCAAVALALGAATVMPSALVAQTVSQQTPKPATKVKPLPRSVIQKLRAFLGVNPPVAVGGSRSGGGQSVCLLSPWPSLDRQDASVPVNVLISRPVLLAAGQLNEVRIEQGNRILWQERASSTKPIEGPIAWPIKPLEPGERVTLKLRPRGASGGDFASFALRAADAQVLAENDRQAQALGNDPKAMERFQAQLKPQQAGLALALLSSSQALEELSESLQCSEH
jgi:hypothetical protein